MSITSLTDEPIVYDKKMKFTEIVEEAIKCNTLTEALTFAAIWESERIVDQARNKFGTGADGAGWDTCFGVVFKHVTDAWILKIAKPIPRAISRMVDPEDGENRAVRALLQLYGSEKSMTVKRMKECLTERGWDNCWPSWANDEDEQGHLTAGGAQDWIRYLFALETL